MPVEEQALLRDGECRQLRDELVHPDQPVGRQIRQRGQHDALRQAEDGCRRPDAKGERNRRNRAEGHVAAKHAGGVPQVLAEEIQPRQPALIAQVLGGLVHAAEPRPRAAMRLFGGHAAALLQAFLHL